MSFRMILWNGLKKTYPTCKTMITYNYQHYLTVISFNTLVYAGSCRLLCWPTMNWRKHSLKSTSYNDLPVLHFNKTIFSTFVLFDWSSWTLKFYTDLTFGVHLRSNLKRSSDVLCFHLPILIYKWRSLPE